MKEYPLTREALASCLNRLKSYTISNESVLEDEEFRFYHKHRNFFNDKYFSSINSPCPGLTLILEQTRDTNFYKDKSGRIWKETFMGNAYHHPYDLQHERDKGRPLRDGIVGKSVDYVEHVKGVIKKPHERFSRKFLSEDEHMKEKGYEGCEFELIVGRDGMRIISTPYMETYNFGPSGLLGIVLRGLHKKFDMDPHDRLGKDTAYQIYNSCPSKIQIVDKYPTLMDYTRNLFTESKER